MVYRKGFAWHLTDRQMTCRKCSPWVSFRGFGLILLVSINKSTILLPYQSSFLFKHFRNIFINLYFHLQHGNVSRKWQIDEKVEIFVENYFKNSNLYETSCKHRNIFDGIFVAYTSFNRYWSIVVCWTSLYNEWQEGIVLQGESFGRPPPPTVYHCQTTSQGIR